MANHSRKDLENQGKASKAAAAATAFGGVLAIAGAIASKNKKKKAEEEEAARRYSRSQEIAKLNSQISEIDNEISNLRSQFLGNVVYDDQISQLQELRRQLVEKRNRLQR